MLEGALLGDGWLDLGAPAADNDPKPVGGEDGDAWGLAQGEEREHQEEKGGGGKEERGLPSEGKEVAEGEAGERGEQWDSAEPEGLDEGGVVDPGGGSTESRHGKRYLRTVISG
jgi:hypothetical protein